MDLNAEQRNIAKEKVDEFAAAAQQQAARAIGFAEDAVLGVEALVKALGELLDVHKNPDTGDLDATITQAYGAANKAITVRAQADAAVALAETEAEKAKIQYEQAEKLPYTSQLYDSKAEDTANETISDAADASTAASESFQDAKQAVSEISYLDATLTAYSINLNAADIEAVVSDYKKAVVYNNEVWQSATDAETHAQSAAKSAKEAITHGQNFAEALEARGKAVDAEKAAIDANVAANGAKDAVARARKAAVDAKIAYQLAQVKYEGVVRQSHNSGTDIAHTSVAEQKYNADKIAAAFVLRSATQSWMDADNSVSSLSDIETALKYFALAPPSTIAEQFATEAVRRAQDAEKYVMDAITAAEKLTEALAAYDTASRSGEPLGAQEAHTKARAASADAQDAVVNAKTASDDAKKAADDAKRLHDEAVATYKEAVRQPNMLVDLLNLVSGAAQGAKIAADEAVQSSEAAAANVSSISVIETALTAYFADVLRTSASGVVDLDVLAASASALRAAAAKARAAAIVTADNNLVAASTAASAAASATASAAALVTTHADKLADASKIAADYAKISDEAKNAAALDVSASNTAAAQKAAAETELEKARTILTAVTTALETAKTNATKAETVYNAALTEIDRVRVELKTKTDGLTSAAATDAELVVKANTAAAYLKSHRDIRKALLAATNVVGEAGKNLTNAETNLLNANTAHETALTTETKQAADTALTEQEKAISDYEVADRERSALQISFDQAVFNSKLTAAEFNTQLDEAENSEQKAAEVAASSEVTLALAVSQRSTAQAEETRATNAVDYTRTENDKYASGLTRAQKDVGDTTITVSDASKKVDEYNTLAESLGGVARTSTEKAEAAKTAADQAKTAADQAKTDNSEAVRKAAEAKNTADATELKKTEAQALVATRKAEALLASTANAELDMTEAAAKAAADALKAAADLAAAHAETSPVDFASTELSVVSTPTRLAIITTDPAKTIEFTASITIQSDINIALASVDHTSDELSVTEAIYKNLTFKWDNSTACALHLNQQDPKASNKEFNSTLVKSMVRLLTILFQNRQKISLDEAEKASMPVGVKLDETKVLKWLTGSVSPEIFTAIQMREIISGIRKFKRITVDGKYALRTLDSISIPAALMYEVDGPSDVVVLNLQLTLVHKASLPVPV